MTTVSPSSTSPASSSAKKHKSATPLKVMGIILLVIGALMVIGGGVAWGAVSSQLREQGMTVPDDAASNAGKTVAGPFTAWSQQETIQKHADKATDGQTYAELGTVVNEAKEQYGEDSEEAAAAQALRNTAKDAAFLRSSLFVSILAFGVSLLAIGTGAVSLVGGGSALYASKRLS